MAARWVKEVNDKFFRGKYSDAATIVKKIRNKTRESGEGSQLNMVHVISSALPKDKKTLSAKMSFGEERRLMAKKPKKKSLMIKDRLNDGDKK